MKKCFLSFLWIVPMMSVGLCNNINYAKEQHSSRYNNSVPIDDLKILDGVLYGFADDTKRSELLKYDTLLIPNSVKKIAPFAFINVFRGNVLNISTVTFSEGLTDIGDYAFKGCLDLTCRLVLPTTLKSIGTEAFSTCNFSGELNLPDNLETIGESCFRNCMNLSGYIKFMPQLKNVGNFAFLDCYSVAGLNFSNIKSIPNWAFSSTWIFKNLGINAKTRSLLFDNTINSLDEWTDVLGNRQLLIGFKYIPIKTTDLSCFKTKRLASGKLKIEGWDESRNIKDYNVLSFPVETEEIADEAFCDVFSSDVKIGIELNEGLKTIGKSAFKGCSGIFGSLVFPSSCTVIKEHAFAGTNITNVDFSNDNNLTIIPEECFANCIKLRKVILPPFNSYESNEISKNAFINCSSLSLIDVSLWLSNENLPAMNNVIFSSINETGIIIYTEKDDQFELNIKNRFITAGIDFDTSEKDFEDSNHWILQSKIIAPVILDGEGMMVQHQTIVHGVTKKTKDNITSFIDICLPDKTKTISQGAFNSLFNFKNNNLTLHLNLGLNSLESNAFSNCDYIVDTLTLVSSIKQIGVSAFEGCKRLRGVLILPPSLEDIGDCAFKDCTLLSGHELELPKGLHSLGSYAFANMTINKIIIPTSLTHLHDFAFANIKNLSVIDATSFNSIPILNTNWQPMSFALNQRHGTIWIKSGSASIKEWLSFFKSFGLPNEWVVIER